MIGTTAAYAHRSVCGLHLVSHRSVCPKQVSSFASPKPSPASRICVSASTPWLGSAFLLTSQCCIRSCRPSAWTGPWFGEFRRPSPASPPSRLRWRRWGASRPLPIWPQSPPRRSSRSPSLWPGRFPTFHPSGASSRRSFRTSPSRTGAPLMQILLKPSWRWPWPQTALSTPFAALWCYWRMLPAFGSPCTSFRSRMAQLPTKPPQNQKRLQLSFE